MQRWDIFCRVVDNFGDIGTCWRLARQLADEHAAEVRLWVDDLVSFARLFPAISIHVLRQFQGPIEVCLWQADFPQVQAADVVIEAFACELPGSYLEAMAARSLAPVWINLEYLSAEAWVDECHLLPSPHARWNLTKYFFFPGFTSRTGGLLREQSLSASRAAFNTEAEAKFVESLGIPPRRFPCAAGLTMQSPGTDLQVDVSGQAGRVVDEELRISLFCYENPALSELLQQWSEGPTRIRVLATPGSATEQISSVLNQRLEEGRSVELGSLTVHALPFLLHPDFDRLLWSCDVNFVRGEDSFVRAQWAERPFVWHIYPQEDGVHQIKLQAFLARFLGQFPGSDAVSRFWKAWNGIGEITEAWNDFLKIRHQLEHHCADWGIHLDHAGDLANNLSSFVHNNSPAPKSSPGA